MPQPIKINYIDDNGKRTSTTISYAIAYFYARHCNKIDDKLSPAQGLAQAVQQYVNENEYCTNKFSIETMLLHESEVAIEKLLSQKYRQQDLFFQGD